MASARGSSTNRRGDRSDTDSPNDKGGIVFANGRRDDSSDRSPDNGRGRSRDPSGGRSRGGGTGRGGGRDPSAGRSRGAVNGRGGGRDPSGGRSRGGGNGRGGGRDPSGGRSRGGGNGRGGGGTGRGGGRDPSAGRSRGPGNGRGGGRDPSAGRSRRADNGRSKSRDPSAGRSRRADNRQSKSRDPSAGRSRGPGNGRSKSRDGSGDRSRGNSNGRGRGRDASGGRHRGADNGRGRGNHSNGGRDRRGGGAGNGQISTYDATLYNVFDGSKYSEDHGYGDETITYKLSATDNRKIAKSINNLIGMMFKENDMKNLLIDLQLDVTLLKSDRFTRDLICKALSTLSSSAIYICDKINGTKKKQPNPIIKFLKNLPFINQPMIKTAKEIGFYTNGLNEILLMMDACDIMKKYRKDPNYYYRYYKELKTKLRPLENNTDEYSKIVKYATNSHGPTHKYDVNVIDIFKVSRRGEFKKYKHYKETYGKAKLLWFGARSICFPSILMKGIKPATHQSPSVGNKFGRGIYFTDCITKAANFCQANKQNPYGILLLTEVALGDSLKLTNSEDIRSLRNGKNSVKGFGKYIPDTKGHIITQNKVQVPLGKMISDTQVNTDLNYNEYVVYKPEQILIQYLIKVKINFD